MVKEYMNWPWRIAGFVAVIIILYYWWLEVCPMIYKWWSEL
jgi:hypothetical protein